MTSIPTDLEAQYRALERDVKMLKQSSRTDATGAIALHPQLQSQFEALLEATPPLLRQQLQPYNTEIFKQIQLLGPDLMRLKLLQPGNKQQAILQRIDERSDRLQDYISSLLDARDPG